MGKSRILTDTPEKSDTETHTAEKHKSKYSERTFKNKTVKKRVITVVSSGVEKEIANVTEESFVVCGTARGDVIRGAVLVSQLK